MKTFYLNDLIKINHPLADRISVQDSPAHYAGKFTSEVAFFRGGIFVTKLIEPFAKYAEVSNGDTLIYAWVPNNLIEEFLKEYKA